MAQVTGALVAPRLQPCPDSNDVQQLKDDRCQPVHCTRQPDWRGKDCCQYWTNVPNAWTNQVVHVDQLNPENFNYNKYRYQMYAQPPQTQGSATVSERRYIAPTTDIRALKQTFYIPVVPTKPGGETEVTFPMTPQTMGQPDMTTACCVPVIPCNPGYQNLTSRIYPNSRDICEGSERSAMAQSVYPRTQPGICPGANRCQPPMQLGSRRVDICSEFAAAHRPYELSQYSASGNQAGPAQFMVPPSNQLGTGCLGLPDTFPPARQLYAPPQVPQVNLPHFTGDYPADGDVYCQGDMPDGFTGQPGADHMTTSVKSVRYADRVARDISARGETPEETNLRLRSMYGAYGACLLPRPYRKRYLIGNRDSIKNQGHGFTWHYPKFENRLCYVIERNPRC